MENKKQRKQSEGTLHFDSEVNMRRILHNAIRMQALYKGKRITIIESSKMAN